MKETALFQLRFLPQVEVEFERCRVFQDLAEPERSELFFKIKLQRHDRRTGRHLPHPVANNQLVFNKLPLFRAAAAERGLGRLAQFLDARDGQPAQHGGRIGQPDGIDDVRRTCVQILFAHQPGGLQQPANGGLRPVFP